MKIGVVSDTHSSDIPVEVVDVLKEMDLIVHAGDLCTSEDLEKFRYIKKVIAVCGNMDGVDLHRTLHRKEILTLEGVTIGIFHGEGPRENILETIQREFQGKRVDVIVFGHSHQPVNKVIKGILYFNPGSLFNNTCAPYRTFGVLEIKEGAVQGRIVNLKG